MALEIVRRFVNGAWKTEAAEAGGGGSLPADWTVSGADALESSSDFAFRTAGYSGSEFNDDSGAYIRILEGHFDLFDVVSEQGNEMFGVGERDAFFALGDGDASPGTLEITPNSFSAQGSTTELVHIGSGNAVKVFRSGQVKLQPSFDGDALPTLEVHQYGSLAAVIVYDSADNPTFRVDADGSVHIKTGTSIVADL